MEPKFNIWIEINGEVALSGWRLGLLRAVAETGSINAAAERLKIQYSPLISFMPAWVRDTVL